MWWTKILEAGATLLSKLIKRQQTQAQEDEEAIAADLAHLRAKFHTTGSVSPVSSSAEPS